MITFKRYCLTRCTAAERRDPSEVPRIESWIHSLSYSCCVSLGEKYSGLTDVLGESDKYFDQHMHKLNVKKIFFYWLTTITNRGNRQLKILS